MFIIQVQIKIKTQVGKNKTKKYTKETLENLFTRIFH